eukprot:INCI11350.2.p1 GENE.INCI11350.2~~INCI11350.2.p1  ORF type:complete len:407 (-),score=81.10 INCI11350.2:283-1503(-)
MGAGASAALGAVADEVLPLETAALIIGPVFEPSAVQLVDIPVESAAASGGAGAESPAVASKGVRKANLFSVYGVELPFGDAITAVMFDSDKSRGRCFVELKDTVRNYSGVFRALQRKYAVADAEHGMTRQEFCDMLESVGNEDLDEGMAGGMYEEITYKEDVEIEEEDVRMTVPELAGGLVRVANQLVQMLGADEAQAYDAIAGQLKWFMGLVGPKLGIEQAQLDAVAALPTRGAEFFSFPAEGWKGTKVQCFLQISIDGADAGRVVVELDTDKTPKTAYNFKCLCTGERGIGELYLRPLHLKGCSVFRIIADQLIQTGDMVCQDGLGGESIYGGKFEDENLEGCQRHDAPGFLSMANDGTSATNSSQFFVTLRALPDLDGQHVCFARVRGRSCSRTMVKPSLLAC